MVLYSHFFQNFPQFIVIHTVKGFGIVNKAEIDVFLELDTREELKQRISGRGLSWEDLMGSCSVTPPLIFKKGEKR